MRKFQPNKITIAVVSKFRQEYHFCNHNHITFFSNQNSRSMKVLFTVLSSTLMEACSDDPIVFIDTTQA